MRVLRILAGLGYPFLVYAGLTTAGPRMLAVTLLVALALQGALTWGHRSRSLVSTFLVPAAGLGVAITLAAVFDRGKFFLFVPALVNASLLIAFARTLLCEVSMVETFARLRGRELPADEIVYCRRNTVMWCLFFALNGSVSSWFALYGSLEWWTLYTGGLSYVMIGVLLGAEMVYRYWRFRPYDGSIGEPLFRKVFPPRESG